MRTLHRHLGDVADSGNRVSDGSLDSPSQEIPYPPFLFVSFFSFVLKSYDHFVKNSKIVVTDL